MKFLVEVFYMNPFEVFLYMIVCPCLISWRFLDATKALIKEIGINLRYYPKHYIKPHRWMRKFYHLRDNPILKTAYFELLIITFYPILGLLCAIGYACTAGNSLIMDYIVGAVILGGIVIAGGLILVSVLIYKRKKDKKTSSKKEKK
jgi:hypothetical protein